MSGRKGKHRANEAAHNSTLGTRGGRLAAIWGAGGHWGARSCCVSIKCFAGVLLWRCFESKRCHFIGHFGPNRRPLIQLKSMSYTGRSGLRPPIRVPSRPKMAPDWQARTWTRTRTRTWTRTWTRTRTRPESISELARQQLSIIRRARCLATRDSWRRRSAKRPVRVVGILAARKDSNEIWPRANFSNWPPAKAIWPTKNNNNNNRFFKIRVRLSVCLSGRPALGLQLGSFSSRSRSNDQRQQEPTRALNKSVAQLPARLVCALISSRGSSY